MHKLITALALNTCAALVAPTRRACNRVVPSAIPTRIPEVFDGYHLPDRGLVLGRGTILGEVIPTLDLRVAANFVSTNILDAPKDEMTGKPKLGAGPLGYDEHLQGYRALWMKDGFNMGDGVPEGYNIFGGDDFAAHLVTFVESSPFFAAGLTVAGDGFEVNTFSEDGAAPSNHFMRVISEMKSRKGRPEVNAKFSVKKGGGLKLESMRVREDGSTDVVTADPSTWSDYASALLYEMIYFCESEHATIHVLHYLLTNALRACTHSWSVPELNAWAEEYVQEVPVKYLEVGALLISDSPEGMAAITGEGGLGGNPDVIPLLEARLDAWGQSATADEFLEKGWLSAPREALEKAGVLTEFFKHVDLGVEFSKSVAAATDPEKLAGVEEDLKKFCSRCGKWKGTVSTLETWIQLMATTGVIHGGTLSLGRIAIRGAVLRWRNADSDEWEEEDVGLAKLVVGTSCGLQEEKHVMGSQKSNVLGKDKPITKGPVQEVFDKYDADQKAIKAAYLEEVKQRPDFNDVGCILSDFCPTGFDGKQLTMATYI